MKVVLYHGSTGDNIDSILKNGFQVVNYVWNVSDDERAYFYEPTALAENDGMEDEDPEIIERECIRRALESACITAGVAKYNKNNLKVLKIEIDSKFIQIDDSCDNMDFCRCVDYDDLNSNMKIKAVYESLDFAHALCGLYIKPCLDQGNYIELNLEKYSETELRIIRGFECEAFDLMQDLDYTQIL